LVWNIGLRAEVLKEAVLGICEPELACGVVLFYVVDGGEVVAEEGGE